MRAAAGSAMQGLAVTAVAGWEHCRSGLHAAAAGCHVGAHLCLRTNHAGDGMDCDNQASGSSPTGK